MFPPIQQIEPTIFVSDSVSRVSVGFWASVYWFPNLQRIMIKMVTFCNFMHFFMPLPTHTKMTANKMPSSFLPHSRRYKCWLVHSKYVLMENHIIAHMMVQVIFDTKLNYVFDSLTSDIMCGLLAAIVSSFCTIERPCIFYRLIW